MRDALEHLVGKALDAATGGLGALSTGEQLAVALILNRPDWIVEMGYTLAEAIDRVEPQWLSLIPQAARAVATANQALAGAVSSARIAQRTSQLLPDTPDEVIDLTATLVTDGDAPGYRDASFVFDFAAIGSSKTHRAQFRIRPDDAGTIVGHLLDVHRRAWRRGSRSTQSQVRPAPRGLASSPAGV
jgi:hypothetical protein